MPRSGHLLFCQSCGHMLDKPESGKENAKVRCEVCHEETLDTSDKVTVSQSLAKAFPSELRDRRGNTQALSADDYNTRAKAQVTCERCGRKEVEFEEKQTRGADEGSTIFYYCACGNTWTTNN